MSLQISVSTNPPKLEDLPNYIKEIDNLDIDFIHCDVMDGKFVTNTTFNYKMVETINTLTSKKLDVHLMVQNPTKTIKKYIKSGADILTIHYEVYKNKHKLIKDLLNIRKNGSYAGLSFSPNTPVEEILPYLYFCDLLLVMSVVPGRSGQEFIPQTIDKLKQINNFLVSQELTLFIEVDGGVNLSNARNLKENNVNSVVLGNYLFSSKNKQEAIAKIKNI